MSDISRVVRLHQNENYWLLDDDKYRSLTHFDPLTFTTYPDYSLLLASIASYVGVSAEEILLTPGSDAAIRLLIEHFKSENKRILLPIPTFYGYERMLDQLGAQYTIVVYREVDGTFKFPTEDVLTQMRNHACDVVFLCQPNNPLGSMISRADMESLIAEAGMTRTTIVVDEAYYEYCNESVVGKQSDSIIVLRTLSKAFGLAGARVGYAVAQPSIVKRLAERMLPWSIAHPSVHAAVAVLGQVDYFRNRVQEVIRQRDAFSSALQSIASVCVYPSVTNFILVRVPEALRIRDQLGRSQVLVALGAHMSRHEPAQKLLTDTLRIGTPSESDMPRVLALIRELVDKSG